jgi:hypothetical protein
MSRKDPTPINTSVAPPKKVSTGVLAGRLYERLKALSAEEDAEIQNAPASIRARFAEKRKKALAAASPEVARLAAQMMQGENGAGE